MLTILPAFRILVVLTVLTGVVYPFVVAGFARAFFAHASGGSLINRGGQIVGSELLAQKFESQRYFWARPSAAEYATVASGASNQGPTSEALQKTIAERRARFGDGAPADILSTSGSGLDPHLTPASALHQATRVAQARALPAETIAALINEATEPPQAGFLGEARVNVLKLNLALDAAK